MGVGLHSIPVQRRNRVYFLHVIEERRAVGATRLNVCRDEVMSDTNNV